MWWTISFIILTGGSVYGFVDLAPWIPAPKKVSTAIKETVTGVIPDNNCDPSVTLYSNGEHPCKDQLIFEDNFDTPFIDTKKWMIEQYTPIYHGPPDFEFVSYAKNDDTVSVSNSKLTIKPIPAGGMGDLLGTLDLRDGCTSHVPEQCLYEQASMFILPPINSTKISSRFSFTYGKIEVKAKLPIGDWIYPQIHLLPRQKTIMGTKLWVAHSRGNSYYIGPDGDLGNTVLFGGPIIETDEPARSRFTSKRKAVVPYGDETHVYTLIWEPDKITTFFNNESYGHRDIDKNDKRFHPFSGEFYLAIGVGVGGINEFPDNYTTSNPKPWINNDSKQVKRFFDAKNTWLQTWKEDKIELVVDSVKIWAL